MELKSKSQRSDVPMDMALTRFSALPTSYQYRPLNAETQEIRLLTLKPLSQSLKGRIECTLKYTSLMSPMAYETVSYCWGDASQRASIFLDGRPLDVPASSEMVLSSARLDDNDRTIWLDAVCINQNDKSERGHQVSIMGKIYRQCSRNLIYLGQDDSTVSKELCNIGEIYDELKQETRNFVDLQATLFAGAYSTENLCFSTNPVKADLSVDSLLNLYARPWFLRLWVFQEAVLAPESQCICGPYTTDLLIILRVAVWLSHKRFMIPREFLMCKGLLNSAKMWELVDNEWGIYDIAAGKSPNLASLLSFTADLGAVEPRDRIYGLIGMIKRQNQSNELPALLMPGYDRPLAHIYRDAVKYSLQESESLYLLRRLSHQCTSDLVLDGFPSWVPRYDREWDESQDPAELADIFNASNGLPVHMTDSIDQDALRLNGIPCAVIADATEVFKARRGYPDATGLLARVKDMTSKLFKGASEEVRSHTVSSTLIAGCNMQLRLAEQEDMQAFESFCQYLAERNCVPVEPHETDKIPNGITKAASLYWHNLRQACLDRRVFTTKCGRLGVGPKALRQGDVVAVLYGGITPYVLRPVQDQHLFMGDAYLHGIMNGELVTRHQAASRQDTTFTIR